MPRIELETLVQAKRQVVFDLSRSIDLHKISTRHTDERAIAGRTAGLIKLNETVTWRAKHFGIYQTLTSKITAFNEPEFFVDEMVDGAFDSFRHEHRFVSLNNDTATRMIDVFEYVSPLGILGRLADSIFLKSYMTNLLTLRNDTIKEYAESGRYEEVLELGETIGHKVHILYFIAIHENFEAASFDIQMMLNGTNCPVRHLSLIEEMTEEGYLTKRTEDGPIGRNWFKLTDRSLKIIADGDIKKELDRFRHRKTRSDLIDVYIEKAEKKIKTTNPNTA